MWESRGIGLIVAGALASQFAWATPERVEVFATPSAVASSEPTEVIEASILKHKESYGVFRGKVPFARLDLKNKQAKALGPVFAFQTQEGLFIHPDAPIPKKTASYAPVIPYGQQGFVQTVYCTSEIDPERSATQCDLVFHLFDFASGDLTIVTPGVFKERLSRHPDLQAAYGSERMKNAETTRTYLTLILKAEAEE